MQLGASATRSACAHRLQQVDAHGAAGDALGAAWWCRARADRAAAAARGRRPPARRAEPRQGDRIGPAMARQRRRHRCARAPPPSAPRRRRRAAWPAAEASPPIPPAAPAPAARGSVAVATLEKELRALAFERDEQRRPARSAAIGRHRVEAGDADARAAVRASARPRAAARPMRKPVKLPGPIVDGDAGRARLASARASRSTVSIIGSRASAWPRSIGTKRCAAGRVVDDDRGRAGSAAQSKARDFMRRSCSRLMQEPSHDPGRDHAAKPRRRARHRLCDAAQFHRQAGLCAAAAAISIADAAAKLEKAIALAQALGLRFKIFDAFRPSEAQWVLWNHTPDPEFPRRSAARLAAFARRRDRSDLIDASGEPARHGNRRSMPSRRCRITPPPRFRARRSAIASCCWG